jgi:hypothetical protein
MDLYIIIIISLIIIFLIYYKDKCETYSTYHYGNNNESHDNLDPSAKLLNNKATNMGLFNINKAALNL